MTSFGQNPYSLVPLDDRIKIIEAKAVVMENDILQIEATLPSLLSITTYNANRVIDLTQMADQDNLRLLKTTYETDKAALAVALGSKVDYSIFNLAMNDKLNIAVYNSDKTANNTLLYTYIDDQDNLRLLTTTYNVNRDFDKIYIDDQDNLRLLTTTYNDNRVADKSYIDDQDALRLLTTTYNINRTADKAYIDDQDNLRLLTTTYNADQTALLPQLRTQPLGDDTGSSLTLTKVGNVTLLTLQNDNVTDFSQNGTQFFMKYNQQDVGSHTLETRVASDGYIQRWVFDDGLGGPPLSKIISVYEPNNPLAPTVKFLFNVQVDDTLRHGSATKVPSSDNDYMTFYGYKNKVTDLNDNSIPVSKLILPDSPQNQKFFLRGDGIWIENPIWTTDNFNNKSLHGGIITDNTVPPIALILPTEVPTTKYLRGDGMWVALAGGDLPIADRSIPLIKLQANDPINVGWQSNQTFLRRDGEWIENPKWTSDNFNVGTIPISSLIFPTSPLNYNFFLRGDGIWKENPIWTTDNFGNKSLHGGIITDRTVPIDVLNFAPGETQQIRERHFLRGDGTWALDPIWKTENFANATIGGGIIENNTLPINRLILPVSPLNYNFFLRGDGIWKENPIWTTDNFGNKSLHGGIITDRTVPIDVLNFAPGETQQIRERHFLRGDGTWALDPIWKTENFANATIGGGIIENNTLPINRLILPVSPLNYNFFLRGDGMWVQNPIWTTDNFGNKSLHGGIITDRTVPIDVLNFAPGETQQIRERHFLRGDGTWALDPIWKTENFANATIGGGIIENNTLPINRLILPVSPLNYQFFLRGDGMWVQNPIWTTDNFDNKSLHGGIITDRTVPIDALILPTEDQAIKYLRGDGTWDIINVGDLTLADYSLPLIKLAGATRDVSQFLRGDNTWSVPIISDTNLDNNTISGLKITDGTITITQIGGLGTKNVSTYMNGLGNWVVPTITNTNIVDGTIDPNKLSNLIITNGYITNNTISGVKITDLSLTVAKINATGTADSTTFLRGDGSWTAVSSIPDMTAVADYGIPLIKLAGASRDVSQFLRGDNTWSIPIISDANLVINTINGAAITNNTLHGDKIQNGSIGINKINAGGTRDGTTFLSGAGNFKQVAITELRTEDIGGETGSRLILSKSLGLTALYLTNDEIDTLGATTTSILQVITDGNVRKYKTDIFNGGVQTSYDNGNGNFGTLYYVNTNNNTPIIQNFFGQLRSNLPISPSNSNDYITLFGGQQNFAPTLLTSANIPNNLIITSKIADNAVTNLKIADNAVTTFKIIDGAVTATKIGSSAVTNVKIASGAITADKIADNAITTITIADANITAAKLNITGTEHANKWLRGDLSRAQIDFTNLSGNISNTQVNAGSINVNKLIIDGTIGATKYLNGENTGKWVNPFDQQGNGLITWNMSKVTPDVCGMILNNDAITTAKDNIQYTLQWNNNANSQWNMQANYKDYADHKLAPLHFFHDEDAGKDIFFSLIPNLILTDEYINVVKKIQTSGDVVLMGSASRRFRYGVTATDLAATYSLDDLMPKRAINELITTTNLTLGQIPNNLITPAKLNVTAGTASATTYYRGDGQWATPGGGGGGTLDSLTDCMTNATGLSIGTVFTTASQLGSYNYCIGYDINDMNLTNKLTSCSQNILMGWRSGRNLTSTSNDNVAIGHHSFHDATTGQLRNTYIGTQAGYYASTNNNDNIGIGCFAGPGAGSVSNTVSIGNNCTILSNGQVRISNPSAAFNTYVIQSTVGWQNISDIRDKVLIPNRQPLGLNFISLLTPQWFQFNYREGYGPDAAGQDNSLFHPELYPVGTTKINSRHNYNLIAQDVKAALDTLGITDYSGFVDPQVNNPSEPARYLLCQAGFTGSLIQSIKDLKALVDTQQAIIDTQATKISQLLQAVTVLNAHCGIDPHLHVEVPVSSAPRQEQEVQAGFYREQPKMQAEQPVQPQEDTRVKKVQPKDKKEIKVQPQVQPVTSKEQQQKQDSDSDQDLGQKVTKKIKKQN